MLIPIFIAVLSAADVEEELLQDSAWILPPEPTTWDLQIQFKKYASEEDSWRNSFGLGKEFAWDFELLQLDLTPQLDGVMYGIEEPLWSLEPSLNLGLSHKQFRMDVGAWSSHSLEADAVYGDYLSLWWMPQPWRGGRFSLGPTFSYHSLDTATVVSYFLGFEQNWQIITWTHGPYLEVEGVWEEQNSSMGKRGKNKSSIASLALTANLGYSLSYLHSSGRYGTDCYFGYSQGVSPSSLMRQNSISSSSGLNLTWNTNLYW